MTTVRRVIVVNDHAYINGGSAKMAIESAKGLARAGIEVTFFAASGPVDASLEGAGIEVVCLNQPDVVEERDRKRAISRGLWNAVAARELRTRLGEADPRTSVVHCHSFSRALSPAIGPVLTKGPVPHVFTMHDFFLVCPNGGFYDHPRDRICTRRPLGASCLTTNCDARHPSHKAWRVLRNTVLHSAGNMPRGLRDIIYVSETQKRAMQQYLPRGARLHHVRNPISIDQRPRVVVEENDVFLYVGRITREKGAVPFARAAAEAGVRSVFVGDGPEVSSVRAANPDAEIAGWVTPREVEDWLERARCLVFPSLWYETYGLVAYEALARGVPVVCGAWNAAAEGVEDGVTGIVYREPKDLLDAIRAMSPNSAGEMSRNAAARSEDFRYPAEDHAMRLMEVYAKLAPQRAPIR